MSSMEDDHWRGDLQEYLEALGLFDSIVKEQEEQTGEDQVSAKKGGRVAAKGAADKKPQFVGVQKATKSFRHQCRGCTLWFPAEYFS